MALLSPPRKARPNSRRSCLSVEALDSREAPSALSVTAAPSSTTVRKGAVLAANAAPVISNFRAVVGPNGQVSFLGNVSDDQAVEGYVVHISGQGVDATATVLKDGSFQVTTVVHGSTDITVMATVTDAQGSTSSPVYTTFTPSA